MSAKRPTPQTTKPRNPQDLTLRNLRAVKKRLDLLEREFDTLIRGLRLRRMLPFQH